MSDSEDLITLKPAQPVTTAPMQPPTTQPSIEPVVTTQPEDDDLITLKKPAPSRLAPKDANFIIFHWPCTDGGVSATIMKEYLSSVFPDHNAVFYPTNHGSPPPDVTGKRVLIMDFSYKNPIIKQMLATVEDLLIIDHHKTSLEDLADIPDKHKIFDQHKSGAGLVWEYCYPSQPMPLFVKYTQDNDLWINSYPDIKAFAAWSKLLDPDFSIWATYFDDTLFLEQLRTAAAYVELNNSYISDHVKKATPKFVEIKGRYFFIGHVNCTQSKLASDIGNAICTNYPHVDFAAVYNISDKWGSTQFSLRSTNNQYCVESIAKLFGGGGHRNASGFSIGCTTDTVPGTVMEGTGRLYDELVNIYFGVLEHDGVFYNVVYLNSGVFKTKLGKYLLQVQRSDVQTCCSIAEKLGRPASSCDIAAVWSFDGVNTTFSIVYSETMSAETKTKLNTKFNRTEDTGVSIPGLVSVLN